MSGFSRTHVFVGTNVGTYEQNPDTHGQWRTQAEESEAITRMGQGND